MARNMDWLRKSGRAYQHEFERFSLELSGLADLEGMPPELSSGLRGFAGLLDTLSEDAGEKEEEKKKALTDLNRFVDFFYNNGRQILDHLEPERAEEFKKLVKAINDRFDLRITLSVVFQPANEEMNFDGETMDIGRETAKTDEPMPAMESFGKIIIRKKSPEEMAEAPDLLNDRQKYLLKCPEEMKELSEMFHTKKSFRLINWNTDVYNKARDTLDAYMEQMSLAASDYERLLRELEKKKISMEDYTAQVKRIGDLADKAAEELRRDMRAYAVHATGGEGDQFGERSVDGKTQAAGAARLSASMGILSFLDRADQRIGLKVEELSETRKKERVNEINYQRLYQKHFKENAKKSDRHRRSASLAQTERKLNREDAARMQAEWGKDLGVPGK
ncbi:MAG: hypothetical protein K5696_04385 [Lachnospiraceae bacterium]|nr:hypothetical protein [Lachnospiraceae bacterium]